MNAGEIDVGPVDEDAAEDALVLRPALVVTVRALPPGGATFLLALSAGATLAQAVERASANDTRFDLTASLAGLIESGAVIAFELAERCPPEGPAS
jgi:hypothetical protein